MSNVWNKIYEKGEFLNIPPHPEIEKISGLFGKAKVRRVLDLGSGGGRHTIYLAAKKFDVYGLDSAVRGLENTLQILSEKRLTAHLTLHDMTTLPYDNNYFDAIISIQVIHHNRLEAIQKTAKEIIRVLKEAGYLWITVPASKNELSTRQEEIEPGTFIPLDGREKGLPHHYFKKECIPLLFPKFSVIDLHIDSFNHYSFLAQKGTSCFH
jgi:SAM-dependent methyltransferase